MAVHVDPMSLFTSIDDENSNQTDRFDTTTILEHNDSINSNLSDSGTEDDDSVFRFDKKSSSYGSARRFFNKSSAKTWKGSKKSVGEDATKDFFTLQFYDDDKALGDTEKIAVRKGKSLKESIESLLHDRDIDFSTHSVFLESSKTPLPLAFDTFPLGGNVLHVKENHSMQVDERIITLMKSAEDDKRVQNQRPKKNLMSSIFNDDVEVPTVNNKHQSITRKSGIASGFNKDDNRTLSDLLNHYTFNYFNTEDDVDGYENSLEDAYLEESWTDIITEYEGMTNKDKIQQETIWELLITERNYLRKLRVIIMVFKNCLVSLQKENFLEEVDINKLFANIKEVYNTNHSFWENYLRHVTEEARATKMPIKPSQLHESFASFEELFQPYIRYCMEEGSCMKYLKQLKRENEMFQEYLTWCENHRQCMRLKLADLFVKPMQRVTKYALLLKAILGKTNENDERTSLENMIFQVDRFVTKINTTLRLRNEQQKLDDVLERIDLYNPIEAANEEMEKLLESHYCNFDLHGNIPGLPEEEQRCILLEGPMKLIEKQGRNDVHAFLFTDVLVLAKTKKGSDKFRIIRQPFRLNKITLHRSKDMGAFIFVYLNEYGVLVTAFTLQVTANEQTKWINAIERAKKRYENARAAKGSTLAFFDDDFTASASALVTSFASTISPMPDRRSITSDDNRLDPSVINKDDLRCRSTEAVPRSYQKPEEIISESHVKRSFSDPKAAISYSVRERSTGKLKGRPRPKSDISDISDHDIATWVLTNENRNQSGSITSDISDDSQRSSGIGDSFRSINSDGSMMAYTNLPEVSKVAQLKARFENHGCDSPANTEGSDSSSPSILGFPENSTALTTGSRRVSPPDYMDEQLTIKEEEENATNHIDRMTTILSSTTDSDKDTENDSSESVRTLNEGSSTLRLSNHSYDNIDFVKVPLKLTYADTASQTDVHLSIYGANNEVLRDVKESGIQCELLVQSDLLTETPSADSKLNLESCNYIQNVTSADQSPLVDVSGDLRLVDISESLTSCDVTETISQDSTVDVILQNLSSAHPNVTSFEVSTQCDEDLIKGELIPCAPRPLSSVDQSTMTCVETKSYNDNSTQCEVSCRSDTSTQCGDFVQLGGVLDQEDGGTENMRTSVKLKTSENRNFNININCTSRPPLYKNSLSDDGSTTGSTSPFMDMLTRPHSALPHRKPVGILKHSHSEANLSTVWNPPYSHGRSRSDEAQQHSFPNSPENNKRNSAPTSEFPGMRALKTLSESLESSLQHRLDPPCNSKTIANQCDEGCTIHDSPKNNSTSLTNPILIRHNSSSSASLRKLAIMNNSPRIPKKELGQSDDINDDVDETLEIDSFNEDAIVHLSTSSPKLRNRIHFDESGNKLAAPTNKRFTWHDFDSLAALSRIEQMKYGPNGRASTLPLTKSISKSTEIISTTKKSNIKRSIIKRFTDVLTRSDDSRTSLDHSISRDIDDDAKSWKKKEKKDRKKLKKERRTKEKEEKKRESFTTKSRSSSVSSGNSRTSIPLSSTNSHSSSMNSR